MGATHQRLPQNSNAFNGNRYDERSQTPERSS